MRHALVMSLVFVAVLGCSGGDDADDPTGLDILTVVFAASAALAAWVSARHSGTSAKAAQRTVEEAQTARREQLAPRLTLEKNFLDFNFIWPPEGQSGGKPAFLSRRDGKSGVLEPATFTLQNFGQNPALELSIVFELDDPNGELEVPERYQELGLKVTDLETLPDGSMLDYPSRDGTGTSTGLPLYSRGSPIYLANCAPNQSRTIEFPEQLMGRLFLRGLQYLPAMKARKPLGPILLTVRITSHAMDGAEYATQFRWEIRPYHYGVPGPIVVSGHCLELPMYPKPDGPRVAG